MSLKQFVAALLLGAIAQCASAAVVPLGPMYPAPGPSAFAWDGGLAGDPAGAGYSYSNFDVTGLTGLYQGLWDPSVDPSASLDGSPDHLTFAGATATTATFSGTTTWTDPSNSTVHTNVPIKLDISITAGPVSWATLPVAGVLFDPALGAVIDNSTGADYSLNLLFSADVGSGFQAINTINQLGGGLTTSSVSLGFYTVPEPGSLSLAAMALAVTLGGVWLRRRK
jgi:hypothetical protein